MPPNHMFRFSLYVCTMNCCKAQHVHLVETTHSTVANRTPQNVALFLTPIAAKKHLHISFVETPVPLGACEGREIGKLQFHSAHCFCFEDELAASAKYHRLPTPSHRFYCSHTCQGGCTLALSSSDIGSHGPRRCLPQPNRLLPYLEYFHKHAHLPGNTSGRGRNFTS